MKIPRTEVILSPARFSWQRLIMGMAPPTEPSKRNMHPFLSAREVRSWNLRARGPLFTVMTSLPAASAWVMFLSPAPPVFTSVGLTSTRRSYSAPSRTSVESVYSLSPTLPVSFLRLTSSSGSKPPES